MARFTESAPEVNNTSSSSFYLYGLSRYVKKDNTLGFQATIMTTCKPVTPEDSAKGIFRQGFTFFTASISGSAFDFLIQELKEKDGYPLELFGLEREYHQWNGSGWWSITSFATEVGDV